MINFKLIRGLNERECEFPKDGLTIRGLKCMMGDLTPDTMYLVNGSVAANHYVIQDRDVIEVIRAPIVTNVGLEYEFV